MLFLIIVLVILVLIFVVNFVVTNIEMFRASFEIVIGFPLVEKWSYTLEGVEFVYIVGGSVLLGALVIALGTWVLDAKRNLKLRGQRKELKRLQQAVQEAKSSLPPEAQPPTGDETVAESESSESPTPEEITKSFEDTVQQKGFLEETEGLSEKPEDEPETVDEREVNTRHEEYDSSDTEKSLPRETAIEAELVESEELSEEEERGKEKNDDHHADAS